MKGGKVRLGFEVDPDIPVHRWEVMLSLSYRERLEQLSLDLADQFGRRRDEEDGIRMRIKLSHRELAHLIGSTRETVAVLLGQLKAEGSVDGGWRSVVLPNPQRLVRV